MLSILIMILTTREDDLEFNRRRLSRRRSIRLGFDTDDRGWTPLHIGARKGDVKEVYYLVTYLLYFLIVKYIDLSSG